MALSLSSWSPLHFFLYIYTYIYILTLLSHLLFFKFWLALVSPIDLHIYPLLSTFYSPVLTPKFIYHNVVWLYFYTRLVTVTSPLHEKKKNELFSHHLPYLSFSISPTSFIAITPGHWTNWSILLLLYYEPSSLSRLLVFTPMTYTHIHTSPFIEFTQPPLGSI
jgi:hypothetical protein